MIKYLIKYNTFLVFSAVLVTVLFLQATVLDLALKIGFKPDDWILYYAYKSLGAEPLFRVVDVWRERGIYTTYQVYYLGLLVDTVGFNYGYFQITSLLFKVMATMAIFPLVTVIFKSRRLAALTTFLFAISPASIGPLEFAVKGSDYLAIFWLCLFMISYYFLLSNQKHNLLKFTVSFVLIILALIFSPIRIYPILILIPLVEISVMIKNRSLITVKNGIIRLSLFYIPLLGILIYAPDSIMNILGSPLGIVQRIHEGDGSLFLVPFSGIGYLFPTHEYWHKIFGSLKADSFESYLFFILGGPTVVFGILTVFLSFCMSIRPRLFFFSVFLTNFILEIVIFFLSLNSKTQNYGFEEVYSVLVGIYITVLGGTCLFRWLKNRAESNLKASGLSFIFLFVFVCGTWLFAPSGTGFFGTSYYLVVALVGSSLFIASLIYQTCGFFMRSNKRFIRLLGVIFMLFMCLLIVFISDSTIRQRFQYLLANGRAAYGQEDLQNRFKKQIKNYPFADSRFFFFDTSEISGDGPFYAEGFLTAFPFWMHFDDEKLLPGCIEVLYGNINELKLLVKEINKEKGFLYRGVCIENGKGFSKEIFYKTDNFYAFSIRSKNFIDIKDLVLKQLDF